MKTEKEFNTKALEELLDKAMTCSGQWKEENGNLTIDMNKNGYKNITLSLTHSTIEDKVFFAVAHNPNNSAEEVAMGKAPANSYIMINFPNQSSLYKKVVDVYCEAKISLSDLSKMMGK